MTEKVLNDAANNPFYVLMTIAGEPESHQPPFYTGADDELHEKNRRYWNRWMATHRIHSEEKQTLIENCRKRINKLEKYGGNSPDSQALKNRLNLLINDIEQPLTKAEENKIKQVLRMRLDEEYCSLLSHSPDFSNTEFKSTLDCRNFLFSNRISFNDANFKNADFRGATFTEYAYFNNATFTQSAYFNTATFTQYADFIGATFKKDADFCGTTFTGYTDFIGATFIQYAKFIGATFTQSANFNNAKFEDSTSFEGVDFTQSSPPTFFGNGKLHPDTNWIDVKWSKPPSKNDASTYRRAYEYLRLIMGEQKKFADEHLFLRLELHCREIEEGYFYKRVPRLSPIFSRLYDICSNYGWSIGRPLLGLLFVWLIGWGALITLDPHSSSHLLDSFSNTFYFLGIAEPYDKMNSLAVQIVLIIQRFFGLIFSFLLVLGLRNRFRIR